MAVREDMDWRESVLAENNRPSRYLRGRAVEVAVEECVVELYADLAPDPSLSTEDTETKEEAEGLPLASNSHRAGWAVR